MALLSRFLILWILLQQKLQISAGPVFLNEQEADSVLQRHKRANTRAFEELLKGNLERECMEERCSLEEAREFFENDEKTMEFWSGYAEGNQCMITPCKNQGTCEHQMGSYICHCPPGFTGRNCEIITARQCDHNNGGCMHFCSPLGTHGAVCSCAIGYKLVGDFKCEPEVKFPCGVRKMTTGNSVRSTKFDTANRTVTIKRAASTKAPITNHTISQEYQAKRAASPKALITNQTLSQEYHEKGTESLKVLITNQTMSLEFQGKRAASPKAHIINQTLSQEYHEKGTESLKVLITNQTMSLEFQGKRAASPKASITNQTIRQEGKGQKIKPSRSRLPLWIHNTTEPVNQRIRIVGGDTASLGEIPWQVALVGRSTQQIFCGGSILSELWIVTAAHCLKESKDRPFFIRAGENNINKKEGTEQDLEVEKAIMHPHYDPAISLYNHDIALLRLRSPINFSDHVRPICLGPKVFSESLLQSGSMAVISGWGRLRFQGQTADTLQVAEVPYVERSECKESSSDRITQFMFCAGYKDAAKDSCQGDSGGPHTNPYHNTWFLTGIVSWGEECAKKGKYGVYTRVGNYYKWIQYVMGITKSMPLNNVDL